LRASLIAIGVPIYYNYIMKICKQCNKEFKELKNRKIFCSKRCSCIHASKISNKTRRNGSMVACETCKKLSYYSTSAISKGKKHYCSTKCKKTGSFFKCTVCKKEFYVRAYRVRTGKVKYCSRSCLAKDLLPKYAEFAFKPINKPYHKYKSIRIDGKQIREHRYIMEKYLGRKLEGREHVHHINNDPSDNRLENLVVLSNSDHQREEYKFRKKINASS